MDKATKSEPWRWYLSRGMIGAFVAIALGAFGLFTGLTEGATIQAALDAAAAAASDESAVSSLTTTIVGAITTAAGLLAAVGRVFAKKSASG